MKTALVYDRVNKWGGAESVLMALHEVFPDAPLYTSVYDKEKAPWAKAFNLRTSFLQKLPLPKDKHELYPFLMGPAFETFNFDEFDVVISVTHEFAKAIITKPKTLHVCYCLTPTSYLWSGSEAYFRSNLKKALGKPIVKYLRFYDKIIANRPDHYLAISKVVQGRIKTYYGLPSDLIYPPATLGKISESGNFHLIVSRLVPNKKLEIAVDAFNVLGTPLKIVGSGRDEKKLRQRAKPNIEFLGHLTDKEVSKYYSSCTALVLPGVEDFGLTAVEAQSFGKPVFAFNGGGAKETVLDGKTGFFFNEQTAESLISTIKNANLDKIVAKDCVKNAQQFSKEKFKKEFKQKIESLYALRTA